MQTQAWNLLISTLVVNYAGTSGALRVLKEAAGYQMAFSIALAAGVGWLTSKSTPLKPDSRDILIIAFPFIALCFWEWMGQDVPGFLWTYRSPFPYWVRDMVFGKFGEGALAMTVFLAFGSVFIVRLIRSPVVFHRLVGWVCLLSYICIICSFCRKISELRGD